MKYLFSPEIIRVISKTFMGTRERKFPEGMNKHLNATYMSS